MLKVFGLVMIFISGSGIGFRAAYNLKLRIMQIKQIQGFLIHMKGELRYSHQPISIILKNASINAAEPFRKILFETAETLELHAGIQFLEIWKGNISHYSEQIYLSKEEVEQFIDLGTIIGCYDRELQINQIDLRMGQWEQCLSELEGAVKENMKLYRCLGVLGSVLVIIILL